MEYDAPTDDGRLPAALGSEDWRVRRRAVDRLVAEGVSDGDVRELLAVLRESHRDFSRLSSALAVLAHTPSDVVPDLVRLLAEADHELRAYVALVLGERGDPRAAGPLIELLADPDTNVRVHAIEALGRLRAADAVEPLLAFVASRDFAVAFPALTALGWIGDARVVPHLVLLTDDPLLRPAAVEALGQLGDRETIEPLAKLLAEPGAPVGNVAQALVSILDRETKRFGEAQRAAEAVRRAVGSAGERAILAASARASGDELRALVRLLGIKPSAEAVSILVPMLGRPELCDAVAESLTTQGSPAVVALAAMLPFADADTQCTICTLLRRRSESLRGDATAIPSLESLLEADEPEVIVAAAETLAAIGGTSAYPALKGLLEHADKGVRHAATLAIAALDRKETPAEFRLLLADRSPLVREAAVKILGLAGGAGSFEAILTSCSDTDEHVGRAAVEYLPEIDDDRVMPLLAGALASKKPLVRRAALERLASRFEQAEPLIRERLSDADPWIRYVALRTLVERASESVTTETLTRLALDPNGGPMRATAISALGARREGFSTLASLSGDADPDVARSAIAALGIGRFAEATPLLAQILGDGEPNRRIEAISALATTASAAAVELLRAAARDPNVAVSAAALAGLAANESSAAVAALLELSADPRLRDACAHGLSGAGDSLVPDLAQGLQSKNVDVRRTVVEVLSRLHTSRAFEATRTAVDDPHPAVRFAAEYALARFRPPSAAPVSNSTGRESETRNSAGGGSEGRSRGPGPEGRS